MGGDNFQKGNFEDTEEIKGWVKFFEGLRRNHSVIVNEDGSGSKRIPAVGLEVALAKSEGAKGLVFAGKVSDRIFTLAADAGIDSVLGKSVGQVTRKNGVQAYAWDGIMVIKDLTNEPMYTTQKGNQKRASGLGLRDAIEDTLSHNDSLTRKKAEELFNEMRIIQEVKKAINDGENVCNIIMMPGYGDVSPHTLFQGNKTYADLFEVLRSLIVSEGVSCRYLAGNGNVINPQGDYKTSPYNTLQISGFLPK